MLKDKNILLGVTGSIAAYKAAILIRLLIKLGANVKVIMTKTAKEFITPLREVFRSSDVFPICSSVVLPLPGICEGRFWIGVDRSSGNIGMAPCQRSCL